MVLRAEFSAHVSSDTHNKSDLLYTVLCNDDNWYRRGIKEVIAIHKIIRSFASPTSRLLVLFTTIFLSLGMWFGLVGEWLGMGVNMLIML